MKILAAPAKTAFDKRNKQTSSVKAQ